MTKEYKMFKDLSRKEQLELVEAALDGKNLQFQTSVGCWVCRIVCCGVHFWEDTIYRISPVEDYIPWEHISDDYQWYVDGVVFVDEPYKYDGEWEDSHDSGISVRAFKGFKKGNINHDAPVKRPEGK